MLKRLEITQPARTLLGIHHKENWIYSLKKENISFRIGKIRLLFYKMGLGMIQLELEAEDISSGNLPDFYERLGSVQIAGKFIYENKIAKGLSETRESSIKKVIEKLLSVQTYIKLSAYKKETYSKAYLQEYFVGNIAQNVEAQLLEMLRNRSRSNMRAESGIAPENMYKPVDYITWARGERTLICYGNMRTCGDDNRDFLINPNKLPQSIDQNYITIYTYLIVLQLLVKEAELNRDQKLLDMLLALPKRELSAEPRINSLFEPYFADLIDRTEKLCDGSKFSELSAKVDQLEEKISGEISDLSKKTDHLEKQVDLLVSFTENELKSFLEEERKKLEEAKTPGEEDEAIGEIVHNAACFIDEKVWHSGDEIIQKEREGLQMLFGKHWNYLLPSSQKQLISAGTLLKKCGDISMDFDYSGICICATAALEAELKRIFFDGLIDYMKKKYGDPGENIESWPDVLLTIPKYRNNKNVKIKNEFRMGNLVFLFGENGNLSGRYSEKKQDEVALTKERMSEYLATIVRDEYKNKPYESFYLKEDSTNQYTSKAGCFVAKCDEIRERYRNKAAHIDPMTGEEAVLCYQNIVTRADTYIYNAEIAGVILELFSKIDGSKLPRE